MTRRRLIAWFTLAVTLWVWAPELPPDPVIGHAAPANAQQTIGIIGAGGVVIATAASVSITNTVAASTLFSYVLPAAFVATTSVLSVAGTVTTTNVLAASLPLHLHCEATFNTNASPGSYNVGVNFGNTGGSGTPGGSATVALVNGITPQASLVNQPLSIDVWLSPIATNTTGNIQPTGATTFLRARWAYQNGTTLALASETTFNAASIGTTNVRIPNTLQVNMQWNTAKSDNAVNLYHCELMIGG